MTQEEILNLNTTKTARAKKLFDLGLTKREVANLLMNGNIGFSYNVWKKWSEERSRQNRIQQNINPFTFSFNRTFGIEIEAYGVSKNKLKRKLENEGVLVEIERYNHSTRGYWKIVTDASLNGTLSFELVSPILKGQNGIDQLRKVCRGLNKAGAKVNKSCGLHVHIGINDYELNDFKNLICNYIDLEKQIDNMMPSSRRKNANQYCQSLKNINQGNNANSAKRIIQNKQTVSDLIDEMTTTRYRKLNLKSFRTYGTAEFRQHSGTTKFSKIKNWVLICSRLVEYSQQYKTNCIDEVLNDTLKEYYYDRVEDLVA